MNDLGTAVASELNKGLKDIGTKIFLGLCVIAAAVFASRKR